MYRVISKQAAAVAAALQEKGYSKDKPFVPSEKSTIRHLIELPLKYVYEYSHEVLSTWPEDGRLFVHSRHVDGEGNPVNEFRGQILDDELTEANYAEESFGTYMGAEISYWLLDGLLQEFFKIRPFIRPKEPFETDFYSIEEHDGKKYIHISGSLWKSDDEWRLNEYVWLMVPLKEFIENCAEKGEDEYLDELFSEAKTGVGELNAEEALETITHYFCGYYPDGSLNYSDITLDTPLGDYI